MVINGGEVIIMVECNITVINDIWVETVTLRQLH